MATFLLDTTVLIAHARGDDGVTSIVLSLLARGHRLAVCCVNVAELERGMRPAERRRVNPFVERLVYLDTSPEAARRAGRYQRDLATRGTTMHLADAIVAATARVHGAIVVTDNVRDFPMRDVRVMRPDDVPI